MRLSFLPAVALGAALCALSACAVQDDPGSAPFAMNVGALTASCPTGTTKNPFPEIHTFKLVVRQTTASGAMSVTHTATTGFGAGQKSISFSDVPSGSPREVTLLGYAAGASTPTWFARKSGVNIKKLSNNAVDLTLMALDGFTCLGPVDGTIPSVVFPAATRIANGKVLITGGFGAASDDPNGTDMQLNSPQDTAYIFDPNTGKFTQSNGHMVSKRGGHSAIYLPKSNKVLIVGGATLMRVAKNGSAPPSWKVEDGSASNGATFEIYDVDKDTFSAGTGQEFTQKRVLPNLLPLSDDYVIVAGGAPWPVATDDGYKNCDLFSANAGGFINTLASLPLNGVRAGSAAAFAGTTNVGTSKYLLWGGNAPRTDQTVGPVAERFKEATQPGEGEFNQDFKIEGDFQANGVLFFPSLTALGAGKSDDGEFLSVGGTRYDVANKKWLPPSADDVYLLTLHEPPAGDTKGRIETKKIPGLAAGVFMHQANLAGINNVVISGGFSAFGAPASATMRAYDVAGSKWLDATALGGTDAFVKRGGHAGLTLSNDCMLLFGGVASFDALKTQGNATSDIYCPKLLVP